MHAYTPDTQEEDIKNCSKFEARPALSTCLLGQPGLYRETLVSIKQEKKCMVQLKAPETP